jgi:hypothetical protein
MTDVQYVTESDFQKEVIGQIYPYLWISPQPGASHADDRTHC